MKTERIVAEFQNSRITGAEAMERYAEQVSRELKHLPNGTFRFVDGVKTYRPVMIPNGSGWRIIVVREA